MHWEQIDDYHQRSRVLGGWLVKAYEQVFHPEASVNYGSVWGHDLRVTMCFVPDPTYSWEV
jgi:hypothetical protein